MFWARAEIFLLSSIISSWTPIPHESGFMRIKCEGWWSFQVLLCFLLTQTSLSHLILSSFLMIGQSFMILLSYWSMISSQESDIISLEAVVEGHPFPVTFKNTLHKCWTISHQQVVNSRFYLQWNACRSLLMKTAWLTSSDGGAVSFGCKSSVNLEFDA